MAAIDAPHETAVKARRALTRRLIDVVGMPESLVSNQERRVASDLLFDILRDSDADLRRKAALKANMARRKAQARGRDRGADEASVDTADPAADDRIPADNDTRNE